MSSPTHTREVEHLDEDWYTHPAWYDILHAAGTAGEVEGLTRIAGLYTQTASGASRQPLWLEPGCGTARYLRAAAARGIRIAGFDNCEAMLRYARARLEGAALEGEIFRATMESFSLSPKADFAFNLINTLRHLNSDAAMLAHFGCIARALRKGGAYAVGLSIVHPGGQMDSEDTWSGARGLCSVTQLITYLAADLGQRVERVVSSIRVQTPNREIHLDSSYALRTYTLVQWLALIERSPLKLVAVCDEYGESVLDDPPAEGEGGLGALICGQNLRTEYALWILKHR